MFFPLHLLLFDKHLKYWGRWLTNFVSLLEILCLLDIDFQQSHQSGFSQLIFEPKVSKIPIYQYGGAYPFSKSSTCLWVAMWAHFVCPFSILVTLFILPLLLGVWRVWLRQEVGNQVSYVLRRKFWLRHGPSYGYGQCSRHVL